MDPVKILAWIAVSACGLFALRFLFCFFQVAFEELSKQSAHRKTRDTPPEKGQVWIQGSDHILIERILDNGNLVIKCGNSSWGQSPSQWKERVRNRRLILISK